MNPSQIARRIYKICENLWNPWENKSQVAEAISNRQHREARILEYIKSVNICGIRGRINLKQQRLSLTYVRVRRNLPQIAQMNTDTGIYKICEICGIRGRINLKQQRLSPTYVRVRRNLPQIAQMNTDTGIYKICEICGIRGRINLKQQRLSPTYVRVQRNLPQIAQMNTDIGCEGVSHR